MSLGLGKPLRLYALRWKICGSSSDRSRVDHFPSGHVLERGGALYPMLSEKQNWDRGEGNAPVPTVRMPGMRTWNKYANVPLEQRIPYNETGDMLGINKLNPSEPPVKVPYKESGHMVRGNNVEILTLAENAAFVYWVTGEEKFARFATDIFNVWLVGTYYMNPILDPGNHVAVAVVGSREAFAGIMIMNRYMTIWRCTRQWCMILLLII